MRLPIDVSPQGSCFAESDRQNWRSQVVRRRESTHRRSRRSQKGREGKMYFRSSGPRPVLLRVKLDRLEADRRVVLAQRYLVRQQRMAIRAVLLHLLRSGSTQSDDIGILRSEFRTAVRTLENFHRFQGLTWPATAPACLFGRGTWNGLHINGVDVVGRRRLGAIHSPELARTCRA